MSWGEEQKKEIETIRERKITVKARQAQRRARSRSYGIER